MSIILGIDEVGRGPWAGPLVIGAVVLGDIKIAGLTDSKKLSEKKRESLNAEILATAPATGLGWVPADELDSLGLSESLKLATRRAVEKIRVPYNDITIDGTINFLMGTKLAPYVTTLKKADLLVPEVSAASIIAKVARDNYMKGLAKKYPDYAFDKHVGYGTAAHKKALEAHGPTPEHRHSFKPIMDILGITADKSTPHKNTTRIGDRAESVVADFLIRNDHSIIARNWKTQMCEIDIISVKDRKIFFTEVKYRKMVLHGSGLDQVTDTKLRQMSFAAESFMKTKNLKNYSPVLAVASVSDETFILDDWFEIQ